MTGGSHLEDYQTMLGTKRIVLALGCLLLMGAYFGFTPSEASETDALVSQPVQGARRNASFPHEKQKHSELDCSKCHRVTNQPPFDVKSPTSGSVYPGHASCAGCHNFAQMFFTQPQFCAICHNGRAVSRSQPALFDRIPKADRPSDFGLDFSHVNHKKSLPQNIQIERFDVKPISHFGDMFQPGDAPKCTGCHEQTRPLRDNPDDMRTATGHTACFVCHGAIPSSGRLKSVKEFPYMNDCRECHDLRGGRSPHLFANYHIMDFRHEDHDYDIRPRTKQQIREIKAEDRLCSECHKSAATAESLNAIKLPEENYCNQCHNGKIGLPDPLAQDVMDTLRRR